MSGFTSLVTCACCLILCLTALLRDPQTWPEPPVILITGANTGIGLGIGCRMLEQLSYSHPPDIKFPQNQTAQSPFCTPRGVKLVIASRNQQKGKEALADLLYFARSKCRGRTAGRGILEQGTKSLAQGTDLARPLTDAEYTSLWLSNLQLDFIKLDLSSVDATMQAAQTVHQKYGYLTHLILNAGVSPVIGVNWFTLFKGFLTDFFGTLASSSNNIEEQGRMTEDGLGFIVLYTLAIRSS